MKDNLTAPKLYLNIWAINVLKKLQNNAIAALFLAITVKTRIHLYVHI